MLTYTFRIITQHDELGTELPSFESVRASNLNVGFRHVVERTGRLEDRDFWRHRELVSVEFWSAE